MAETNLEFLARRRVEELESAVAAESSEAKAAHRMLARLYFAEMARRGMMIRAGFRHASGR